MSGILTSAFEKALEGAQEAASALVAAVGQQVDELSQRDEDDAAARADIAAKQQEETAETFDGTADTVREDVLVVLQEHLAEILDEALPGALDAGAATQAVVEAGEAIASLASALAPPLEWAQRIVETINKLLTALNLGS